MSSPMQAQAVKVWGIVTDSEFWDIYRKALDALWQVVLTTVNLLKEVGILMWLTICLVLVAIDWLWAGSISAYGGARNRWQDLTAEKEEGQQIGSEAGKALLTASKSSLALAIAGARSQLGLPEKIQAPMELEQPAEKEKVAVAAVTTEAPAKAVVEPVAEKAVEPEAEAKPEETVEAEADTADEAEEA